MVSKVIVREKLCKHAYGFPCEGALLCPFQKYDVRPLLERYHWSRELPIDTLAYCSIRAEVFTRDDDTVGWIEDVGVDCFSILANIWIS